MNLELETILVPLDGSPLAELALPAAIEHARGSGAELLLLRAAQARALPGADPIEGQIRVVEEAEAYLGALVERLAVEGLGNVKPLVWYGGAAYAIIEAARFHKVDLIVMTSHGRSGLGRLIMGSVAESVLRGTTTPILLIRPDKAPLEAPARERANAMAVVGRPV
jgi:nucleotide-binding universal stress UspA family protein